ncbi:MAG: mannosyl-3-phosphoglycerate phosphatase [Nitrospirae bacterium]|nr:mannosyl-3-phosphoglycerate phosphatase [Nitrospirota bacterium]
MSWATGVGRNKKPFVIFTDLDGTLLDAKTYSWEAARPALDRLREKRIPLVLCSSKTKSEIEAVREEIQNHDPFISENGGGIFVPEDYFPFSWTFDRRIEGYKVIEPGMPYARLREALQTIARRTGLDLKGYGDLSVEEVAAQTGLSLDQARRSKRRDYDEPFVLAGNPDQRQRVLEMIVKQGLRWTKGSRYYHLTGANDKGRAARIVTGLFEQKFGKLSTVALGDSPNDLPMLAVVNYPILVRRPDGRHDETMRLPHLVHADGIGPVGWNSAVLKLLNDYK